MDGELLRCENCDGVIGRLEKSHTWQGHRVCAECIRRLEQTEPSLRPRPASPPSDEEDESAPEAEDREEEVIWSSPSSQFVNLRAFALCAIAIIVIVSIAIWARSGDDQTLRWVAGVLWLSLLVPIGIVVKRYLDVRFRVYTVTTQRLRIRTGVFSRHVEELELYRVKDTTYVQPFLLRLFKLGHIVLGTSDRTTPTVVIEAVPYAVKRREDLRRSVEQRRDSKRVREVDFE